VFGFNHLRLTLLILELDPPTAGRFIVRTTRYPASHLQFATHCLHLFGACFPHHTGTFAWIAEGINERFNYVCAVSVVTLRHQGILDGAAERKAFDSLRRPVGGNLVAAHSPDFFSVTLEECVEEPFAELIAYPLFEIPRIADRKQARLYPRKNAES
jgi:hypothetical protein